VIKHFKSSSFTSRLAVCSLQDSSFQDVSSFTPHQDLPTPQGPLKPHASRAPGSRASSTRDYRRPPRIKAHASTPRALVGSLGSSSRSHTKTQNASQEPAQMDRSRHLCMRTQTSRAGNRDDTFRASTIQDWRPSLARYRVVASKL
jgi:hypothetical protein